ncbi:hypothetical protein KPL74_16165 [Bacillus sp. NP157]|nr:hypothetical protein KPL74_16165 [Bacillus sp. NP157]
MPELSSELVALLQYLAPGFLVAWIYHGITAHSRPSHFERVVQALLYTVIVQAVVSGERQAAFALGRLVTLGSWSQTSDMVAGLATAVLAGLIFGAASNRDMPHAVLRRFGLTTQTAHPDEWAWVFSRNPRFVTLYLCDGTIIFGWPSIWPSDATHGHFFVTGAVWRSNPDTSESVETEGILINVSDVKYVEFL